MADDEGRDLDEAAAVAAGRPRGEWLVAPLERERDRWFLWLPVTFGSGILAYMSWPTEPSSLEMAAIALGMLALWIVGRARRGVTLVVTALLAMASGAAIAKIRTEFVAAPVLTADLRDAAVAATILQVEAQARGGIRLTLTATRIADLDATQRPRRIRVRFRTGAAGFKPGDAITFRATLAPPPRPALPGGYDFARQAYFQQLGAVGFALSPPVADPTGSPPSWSLVAWARIERLRQAIGTRVQAAIPGENGHIATALLTGERGGITQTTNDLYRDSGIFHILSISGLHMSIMAGAVFFSIRALLALSPAIALAYPIKKWAALGAATGALGYLLISGLAFATVRSYLMISVMFFAILVDRPALALRNVAIAALLILVLFPESLFDVGFQMSFAAVTALVATYEAIRERRRELPPPVPRRGVWWIGVFLGGIVLTTLVASLSVAPFAAYHFHKSQQYAVIANLIAVPVCNFIVMPAALATFLALPFGLEAGPLKLMSFGIDAMSWSARLVAGLPGAVGRIPAIPDGAFALMVAGGLWLLLWRGRRRWLGIGAIAAGLALAPTLQQPSILVGRDGRLVALRQSDGTLSALDARGGAYELSRWLEADGDARDVSVAASAKGVTCDPTGCIGHHGALVVAVSRHPASLADDCRKADLVIIQHAARETCPKPKQTITAARVKLSGTHAVFVSRTGAMTIRTVAEHRGDRPWSKPPTIRATRAVPKPGIERGIALPNRQDRPPRNPRHFASPHALAQPPAPSGRSTPPLP